MFLSYSHCFVLLTLHCPLLHHILKPWEERNPSVQTAVTRCVEAAMEAVAIAEAMESRGMFREAYALTVDILAMAATSLLVVELGAPGDYMADRARMYSKKANVLLEILARQSCAAARCLESLNVSASKHLSI